MDPGPVVAGIDIAASRPCVAVAVRCARTLEVLSWAESDAQLAGDRERLFAWLEELGAVAVGVDAPQRPRRARGAVARGRAPATPSSPTGGSPSTRCPHAPSPRRRTACTPGWRPGWDYFRELGRRGYEPPAPGTFAGVLGQAPAALEVYPHATFVSLLGGTPPPKSSRAGLRVRVAALRAAGMVWDEYYDHDSLDALAAALTAWRFVAGAGHAARGRARRLHLAARDRARAAAYLRPADRAGGPGGRPPPRRLSRLPAPGIPRPGSPRTRLSAPRHPAPLPPAMGRRRPKLARGRSCSAGTRRCPRRPPP